MALQKSKTLPNGITGNYWVAAYSRINNVSKKIVGVDMLLFPDQTTRQNYPEGIYRETKKDVSVDFTGKTMAEILTEIYTQVKASEMGKDEDGNDVETNWFADAVDN